MSAAPRQSGRHSTPKAGASSSSYLYEPTGSLADAVASTAAYLSPFSNAMSTSSTAPISDATVAAPGQVVGGGSQNARLYAQPPNPTMAMSESNRLLADIAPHIMRPRMLAAALQAGSGSVQRASSSALVGFLPVSLTGPGGLSLAQPARSLARLSQAIRTGPVTSRDLRALENSVAILEAASGAAGGSADAGLEEPTGVAAEVSLYRGFQATMPTSLQGRARRRKARARDAPRLGLKAMSDEARGLLTDSATTAASEAANGSEGSAVGALERTDFRSRQDRRANRAMGTSGSTAPAGREGMLSAQELEEQRAEIVREKEDINIRRMLLNSEIQEVEAKIQALRIVREGLDKSLLGLREDELELDEEYAGVSEMLALQEHRRNMPGVAGASVADSEGSRGAAGLASRRRRGPVFLPSEHDELPPGVAFMTLSSHHGPITDLDFSEPYGALVSAASDDAPAIVWDLSSGGEVGRLRGHDGTIKCLQVEDELCVTGGADAGVRLWDLRRVEDWETRLSLRRQRSEEGLSAAATSASASVRGGERGEGADDEDAREWDPCLKKLDGHSKSVTSLYFDDTCLVTGASDKTLRQWDLNTGQCVLTMDILWAISNPSSVQGFGAPFAGGVAGASDSDPTAVPGVGMGGARRPRSSLFDLGGGGGVGGSGLPGSAVDVVGAFSYPTPPYEDGSWEMYTDFVGGVQFWGYALASGSGDGAVRMWDMRTGQAHRTLMGHTAPVTCLQFDETHIVSGSLDKSIRIWDLRTGGISDTIKYDHPVTALQFDTRKIVAAAGENQVKIFNRTTLQHAGLSLNGHTKPIERVRYMDRYAVSGSRDHLLKVWAL